MKFVSNSPYFLEDVTWRDDPHNMGLQQWAVGPENKKLMLEAARRMQARWRGIVAKRTRNLASTSVVSTSLFIGSNITSWTGSVWVYGPKNGSYYAAAHEFGYGKRPQSYYSGNPRHRKSYEGHHELRQVLGMGGLL